MQCLEGLHNEKESIHAVENQVDKKLLISYFSGNASANQKRQIELWLESNPEHWDVFYQSLEEWERNSQKIDFNTNTEFENLTQRIFLSALSSNRLPGQKEKRENFDPIRLTIKVNKWQKIAAAVIVLMVISALTVYLSYGRPVTHMACGNIKNITLPDGSSVTLNIHSKISYRPDWKGTERREVWLEGEAFFSVMHTTTHRKFVVHTSDHVNMEVIGTQFTVSQRTGRTRVVLNSGKVRLHIKDIQNNAKAKSLHMKPGELVEYERHSEQYIRKRVNPEVYSSWKDNRLLFDNTSLPELRALLKERYGLQVVAADTSLSGIRFNGSFPSGNVKILLKALATTYNLQITTRSTQVYLEPKNKNE